MKTAWMRLLLVLFLTSSHAWSMPTYTVGVEETDLTPMFWVNPMDKSYNGIAREVLDRFAKHEKIKLVYVPLPIKRFLQDYWNGKFDFAFPDNPNWNITEKKNLKIIYSEPFISFEDAILVPPDKLGKGIDRVKIIGTVRGFTVWKLQSQIQAKKMKVEEAPTPEALIHMALLGRVDAINLSLQNANYHLKKMGRSGQLVPDPALLPIKFSSYHLSSLQHPKMIQKFNRFLKKNASEIKRIERENGLSN